MTTFKDKKWNKTLPEDLKDVALVQQKSSTEQQFLFNYIHNHLYKKK